MRLNFVIHSGWEREDAPALLLQRVIGYDFAEVVVLVLTPVVGDGAEWLELEKESLLLIVLALGARFFVDLRHPELHQLLLID